MTEPDDGDQLIEITTQEELERYLHAAVQLEHATLPIYLTALYSIHSGSNPDAYHVLRAVAVEEMLHLTLAANVLNAIGGSPDLTVAGFVPSYPGRLPDGEEDFEVGIGPFTKESLESFCRIERPTPAPDPGSRVVASRPGFVSLLSSPLAPDLHFYSIGEFYAAIERGLDRLYAQDPGLFRGDRSRQVTSEYFYSGGGEIIEVFDLASAKSALALIAEQGEGLGGGIYDNEDELSHYYRFDQLRLGRYYQPGDGPGKPTGDELTVDWDAVYPAKPNARLADYPAESELAAEAVAFNEGYAAFLAMLTRAFTGSPELLIEAVWDMFRLRDRITALMRNPINGSDGPTGSPTFEVPGAPA